jgi:hypothetical protein
MISVEEAVMDAVTAALHQLLTGKVPPATVIPQGLADNRYLVHPACVLA